MAFQPFLTDCSTSSAVNRNCVPTRGVVKLSRLSAIELVQNDTGPQFLMTLRDTNTGDFLDLSAPGIEVQFNFSSGAGTETKAVIPMTAGPNALLGQVMLDWVAGTSGALNTVGTYYGEVQITWADGRIQTTPTKLKFHIRGGLG